MGSKINLQGVKRSPEIPQINQSLEVNQDSGSRACLKQLNERVKKLNCFFKTIPINVC